MATAEGSTDPGSAWRLKWEKVASFMQKTEGQGARWGQSDQLNNLKIGGEQEKQDTIAGEWGRGLLSSPGPEETR